MFSSLLRRPRPRPRRVETRNLTLSPPAGPAGRKYADRRHASADFTEADDDEEGEEDEDEDDGLGATPFDDQDGDGDGQSLQDADEDGPRESPVLPLFSATHLDSLPVYSLTHSLRIIVCARTETTLTWEQLRSPQVSQFLVKPMQQQIRTQNFSRATLYALMANCLQFTKEAQRYAANAGTSNTRAKVCELLAIKILKEYTTRELIDALAYDFYPLQGMPGAQSPVPPGAAGTRTKRELTASRTSTLEVAIRASAKHFLAHPVVIQQLEAIWSGAITFYSAADSLHRDHPSNPSGRGVRSPAKVDDRSPLLGSLPPKQNRLHGTPGRRTVMLYDPRSASVMKLSRLRVPRYRSFLSTLSLAVLIGLFLAVLADRSVKITALELVFWFWSAGFMLDELVGFNEQGFALYIMSFWNIFDLGILLLLIVYYCMRAYGVFLPDPHRWNDMAYDVLAANAILLLPRIFSVLDHYPYFSQLLIAFRLMAVDLAAVFVLIMVACSGFYVFFTLSNNNNSGSDVAYKIFQILMGFSPAAWDVWPSYNFLARTLLVLFLIICHFLVVTILITVLTNSFMKIASNATEEHQFLFAINTISMVKNDSLFSYIAPSNIFAWLLMPLRYCMPLTIFVKLNRTVIKATHFPILFCIYLYEKFWLAPSMFEPTDLVENPGRGRDRQVSFADPASRSALISPNVRIRDESMAGFQKDRALEEVFRRRPDSATLRTRRRNERRKTQTAIRNWMDQHDEEGVSPVNWPTLDSTAIPEMQRRFSVGWDRTSYLRQASDARSIASDPADLYSNTGGLPRPRRLESIIRLAPVASDYKDNTDAEGDDELVTNEEDDEDDNRTMAEDSRGGEKESRVEQDASPLPSPVTVRSEKLASSHGGSSGKERAETARLQRQPMHSRTQSSSTVLFRAEEPEAKGASGPRAKSPPSPAHAKLPRTAGRSSGGDSGGQLGSPKRSSPRRSSPRRSSPRRTSPRRPAPNASSQPRPILPPRGMRDVSGCIGGGRAALHGVDTRGRARQARRLSSADLSMFSDNAYGGEDLNQPPPGSFQTQMAMAMMKDSRMRVAGGLDVADRDRMGRLVLARMKTLEESFADVVKEMRALKNSSTAPSSVEGDDRGAQRTADDTMGSAEGPSRIFRGDDATPKTSPARRPVSRRSQMEQQGVSAKQQGKQKGKQVARAETTDEAERDESWAPRKGDAY